MHMNINVTVCWQSQVLCVMTTLLPSVVLICQMYGNKLVLISQTDSDTERNSVVEPLVRSALKWLLLMITNLQ